MDNYDFATLITDTLGEAELSLDARLNTTSNGTSYAYALFSDTTVLRVDYYQPDVAGFIFNTKIVDLEAEQHSTPAINQKATT